MLILAISTTIAFSQSEDFYDIHKKITITNPSQETINALQLSGIDLKCGAIHDHNTLTLELSNRELESLQEKNIPYTVEVEDLLKFYSERAEREMPEARTNLEAKKAASRARQNNNTVNRPSVSNVIHDNIIQYTGADEISWAIPQNYHYGTMGSCLTISEVLTELDEMKSYSDTNGLDIVSAKQDASPTNQTTWGNPQIEITNNGETYDGQGVTSNPLTYWDPQTVYYIRITGNQSTSLENSKPQMLFTSMIHSREVSALMNNIYFMWYIIENYDSDPAIKELVDNNELYFVPVVNPDGLRWNEKISPTAGGAGQRKNLRPDTGGTGSSSTSRGVDLNRNFDYFWGYNSVGSSGSQTSGTYRGPSRASEPETQIMVDFILAHQFKTGVWNHSYANSVPHPYGGIPSQKSDREDEMYTWHEEMTRYNRYLYGATIFYESNGLPDDWMVGSYDDGVNPPVADLNGSFGSQQGSLATTPEHGSTGFWPSVANLDLYAQRSVRISLASAYYGGKYAKLHDLTQSDISTTTVNLDFGIERIGQTASAFSVVVTPISNIQSVTTQAPTESSLGVLEQKTVTATIELVPGISANDAIEYNVKLVNDNGTIYEADFKKYYNPTVLFSHDPDTDGLTGWTQTGGWNNSSVDAYSGSDALRTGDAVPYASSNTKTLTTTNSYDFSSSDEVLIQFYTKWDLERNYDFVEILGSTDGSNWQPLTGNYTKPNATSTTTNHDNKSSSGDNPNFQANSQGQIYDGDRLDRWVMEEIVIDGSNNTFLNGSSTAQIRFNFRSDNRNVNENFTTTNDGFFIDDFKIIGNQVPCLASVPESLALNSVTTTTATASWTAIPSANYDLRYRVVGAGSWIDVAGLTTNSYDFTSLTLSTSYEVEVRTNCGATMSAYTTSEIFTTLAVDYCAASGTGTYDTGVTQVSFNDLINSHTNNKENDGYQDFLSMSTTVMQGTVDPYILSVNVDRDGGTGHAFAWIDFNIDGDFDDPGEEFDLGTATTGDNTQTSITPSITFPTGAGFPLGPTRMRIATRYNSDPTGPCATGYDGEVEDYTINIDAVLGTNVEVEQLDKINVFPNPVSDLLFVSLPSSIELEDYKITNLIGQVIMSNKFENNSQIDVSSIKTGVYMLSLNTDKGIVIKKIVIQ